MELANAAPSSSIPTAPSAEVVADFWSFARDHVGWATVEGLFGQQQASTMIPPWMHLDADADRATSRAQQLVEDGTLDVVESAQIYPEDALPQRGDLAVIVDGTGRPVALAATLRVTVAAGGTEETIPGVPEDDRGEPGKIVTETLRCLYPVTD